MSTPKALVARVRGEYREMPGLRLTFPQACRLWALDRETCEAVLQSLMAERFLFRTTDGAFIAMPSSDMRPRPAKAHLPPIPQFRRGA